MTLAERFHALFAGKQDSYGTYNNISQQRDDGKLTGEPLTKRLPVTLELFQQHLDAKNGLGIVPIREDNTCVFGAGDIDVYEDLDPAAIATQIARLGLPMIPCRSKSGGCHVYLFTKEPVPAATVVTFLRDAMARLGYGNCEIFPKQTRITEKDLGSWINLPYFGMDETTRYAVKPNGDPYTVEEFLQAADALKVDAEFFTRKPDTTKETKDGSSKGKQAIPEGPPCLQHLVELGVPEGTRNNTLHALGTYARKARPNDWKQWIEDANRKYFTVPLGSDEVNTIIGSLTRGKEYHYKCSSQPLVQYCNSVACRSRKYGIGGGGSAFPILGNLRKLMTSPPCWFLDVTNKNGDVVPVEMTTEQLQDPKAFQRLCIDNLDMMPQMPTAVIWQQMIQQLLGSVQNLDAPPEEASTEGVFWDLVEQFCTGRFQAQSKDEIMQGKPWTDGGRTYFRTTDLLNFLTSKQFKDYKVQQVAKVLMMRKGPDKKTSVCQQHGVVRIGSKTVHLWSLPEFARRVDTYEIPDSLKDDTGAQF